MTHPVPSQRARDLVRGAYDLHVHSGPDTMPRIASTRIARDFRDHGPAGYVISHGTHTAGCAALAREATRRERRRRDRPTPP